MCAENVLSWLSSQFRALQEHMLNIVRAQQKHVLYILRAKQTAPFWPEIVILAIFIRNTAKNVKL